MALIKCPECGKEISDTTPSCPHCGYRFSTVSPTIAPTAIGETRTNIIGGIALIAFGCVLAYLSLLLLSLFNASPLFLLIFGYLSFVLIRNGLRYISGMQDVYCPYCGRVKSIPKGKRDFKCPSCKKRSVRVGDQLKPVP